MRGPYLFLLLICGAILCMLHGTVAADPTDAEAPTNIVRPFESNTLDAFTPWLKATQHADPENVFTIADNVLHIRGGDHRGYLGTKASYKDYHLSIEYRWGKQTDGGKYVRNSGVLLHATGKDGGARGVWMASVEVQLAQGCEGDFIVIRGDDAEGESIKTTLTCNTRMEADGRTRWQADGKPTDYSGRQFWWSKHDPKFKELLDTRGRWDVASRLGEWTRVDCICRGDCITVKINGHTVNECYRTFPASGRILLQNEGHEVFFRNMEIRPLKES